MRRWASRIVTRRISGTDQGAGKPGPPTGSRPTRSG